MTKPIFPPHEVQRTGRDEKSNNPLTELNECSYPPYCISLFYLQIKPFYTDIFYLHSLWSYPRCPGVPLRGSFPLPAENPALPERTAVLHARVYSEGNGAGCHRRSPTRDGACMRKRDTFRSSACDTRNSRGGSVPDRPHRTPAAEKRGVRFHKLMQVTTSGTLAAL